MCGLTAVINKKLSFSLDALKNFERLSTFAEERGKDTSGVFLILQIWNGDIISFNIKCDAGINYILNNKDYLKIRNLIKNNKYKLLLAVSHTRMATVGDTLDHIENQPLIDSNVVLFYNGIYSKINFENHNIYSNQSKNDGWIYINHNLNEIDKYYGIANIIRFNGNNGLLEVFSNNGDLFNYSYDDDLIYISSDSRFLNRLFRNRNIKQYLSYNNYYYYFNKISISKEIIIKTKLCAVGNQKSKRIDSFLLNDISYLINEKSKKVHRCKKRGSPEINEFNEICFKCEHFKLKPKLNDSDFIKIIRNSNNNSKPILVGLSGGRDSTYVLSQLVEKWDLKNIVTYTFDWGVNTPYARLNVSKICSYYGIRNILVSADIRKKRRNVKQVLNAYCSNPIPGLIPLLMAGDKQFISSAHNISKELNSSCEIFGFNPFEKTRFKEELIWKNLWPDYDDGMYGEDLSGISQIKLILGYASKIISNPRYWGYNLFGAAKGFINYYHSGVSRTNYFDYFEWNEDSVNEKIKSIGWISPENRSTWRIGDGTSAFYNIAYCLHQGWSENDVLRSNQVRNSQMSLDHSLKLVEKDNIPDFNMLEWYFSIMNLDPNFYLKKLMSHYTSN